jgi:hypothetical protein
VEARLGTDAVAILQGHLLDLRNAIDEEIADRRSRRPT